METKKLCILHIMEVWYEEYIFFLIWCYIKIRLPWQTDLHCLITSHRSQTQYTPHSASKLCVLVYFRARLCQINNLIHMIYSVNKNRLEGRIHIYLWNVILGKKQVLLCFKRFHWKILRHSVLIIRPSIMMKYLKNFLDQPDFLCALQELKSLEESILNLGSRLLSFETDML